MSERGPVELPAGSLAQLFPFFVALDQELRLVEVGPSFARLRPDARGRTLPELFRAPRLPSRLDYSNLAEAVGEHLRLEALDGPLILRGVLLERPGKELLFLGQPWLTDVAELSSLGLNLRDFPAHSPLADLLHLLQARDVAMRELRQLTQRLQLQKVELRAAQDELHDQLIESERAEAFARSILETAADGIITIDEEGIIQTANSACESLFGYTPDELVGQNVSILIPEPDRSEHDGYIRRYLETGESRIIGVGREVEAVRRDGSHFPIYLSIGEMAVGDARHFTGIVQDITERRRRDEELRASEKRLRDLLDNMLEGQVILDVDGIIQDVNPSAQRIFGYRPDELRGRSVRVLLPEEPEYEAEGFLDWAYEQAIARTTEWRARRKSGEVFPMELQLYEVETPSGQLRAGHVRDLSERQEVDRLKKQFVATVSHELRTPLTSIHGSLGLLSAGAAGPLPDEVAEMVTIAERSTERLVALLNDILDLERLGSGRLRVNRQPTRLQDVHARAVESVRALADERDISITVDDTDSVVLGEADRIVQVIVNLLGNAIRFSGAGSRIDVRSQSVGEMVRIEVQDQGSGVPVSQRQMIFEPFHQMETSDAKAKGGTGLGLAICRSIVQQHGGKIGVESSDWGGARFWFTLPRHASAPRPVSGDDA